MKRVTVPGGCEQQMSVVGQLIDARAVLGRLLASTPTGRADGRPLYAYRFSKDDADEMRRVLKAGGARRLASHDNAAVFVAYAAEWFRRDRNGGHWDWCRPLAEIGVVYGQDDPRSTLSYAELSAMVETGLRWWRRPAPAGGQRLIAIIREAGFPAAALRNSRAVLGWLQNSVRRIEQGFQSKDAVAAEAWRMNATSVVQATYEVAVLLCDALADLRARVREIDPDAVDPIQVLDDLDPDWRDHLPFELDARDVATVIEGVIRAPRLKSSALTVSRSLRRSAGRWQPWMDLGLSGDIDGRRMPSSVSAALADLTRARVGPRGGLGGSQTAVAAFETVHDENDGVSWHLRPLVGQFEIPLALETDVQLGLLDVEGRVLEEFVAEGGEGLELPVIAFEAADGDDPDTAEEWAVLGCSSVRTRRTWLALAIADDQVDALEIEGDRRPLGTVKGGRTLIAMSGVARFKLDGGLTLTWRTSAEDAAAPKLALFGSTVRGPRETVFQGMPRIMLEIGDSRKEAPVARVVWKGRRQGRWSAASQTLPRGRVLLGVTDANGELLALSAALIAPADLHLQGERTRKRLLVKGGGPEGMAARAGAILTVDRADGVRSIDLSTVSPGQAIELTFAWPAPATLTLPNPVTRHALLGPTATLAGRQERLSVGRLHGWRLLCSEPSRVCFELVGRGATARAFTRPVEGETPLIAYLNDIRNLLGSSDALDGAVRLSWIGQGDWFCEIRRYETDLDILANGGAEADVLKAIDLGVTDLAALDLSCSEMAPLRIQLDELPAAAPTRVSPNGGPWLVFGTLQSGGTLRPCVVRQPHPTTPANALSAAMAISEAADREAKLLTLMADPFDWNEQTLALWSALPATASAERIPYAAIDALRLLHRRPDAAVRLLAEAADAQLVVLALQYETPLIWAATPIKTWIAAFENRLLALERQLKDLDVGLAPATLDLLAAAGRLLDAAPGLATHVRAVVLALCGGARAAGAQASFDLLAARLATACPAQTTETLAKSVNIFVQRHIDGPAPPSGMNLRDRSEAAAPLVRRFPEAFGDLIAAPFVAADSACGRIRLDRETAAACRAAWLFDPDHFETMTAAACRGV